MYVANVLREISNGDGLWTGSHIPATDKKSNNYYFCGIIFKMEINLPCVVIAPIKRRYIKVILGAKRGSSLVGYCSIQSKPALRRTPA